MYTVNQLLMPVLLRIKKFMSLFHYPCAAASGFRDAGFYSWLDEAGKSGQREGSVNSSS